MRGHHENSRATHTALREEGSLGRRANLILDAVIACGPCTDRQLRNGLGFDDMNSVRPRISELKKGGFIEECGKVEDPVTGKPVRLVRWTGKKAGEVKREAVQPELFGGSHA